MLSFIILTKGTFPTGLALFAFIILGLFITALVSLIKPVKKTLSINDKRSDFLKKGLGAMQEYLTIQNLFNDENYVKGYQIGAQRVNGRKVWAGFGLGAAIIALLLALILIFILSTLRWR